MNTTDSHISIGGRFKVCLGPLSEESRLKWGASLLGFLFFAMTVGVEKIDPRNVQWLNFKDQKAHWLGWLFFAEDQWRWPLGANPQYGWGGFNSIVNSDSWPVFALLFKLLNLEIVNKGQYFGIAFLVSSVLLFGLSSSLFRILGLSQKMSLIGSVIVGTTPMFWWMQRWYPAISGGMCLLVWAFYLYFRGRKQRKSELFWWLVVLGLAVGTNIYLAGIILPVFFASRFIPSVDLWVSIRRSVIHGGLAACLIFGLMYTFGYFTMPSSGAITNRYGVYTANALGLIDVNKTSRFIPDIPSLPLQYEPTSVGAATVILTFALLFHVFSWKNYRVYLQSVRRHKLMTGVVLLMAAFAVSNLVSFGTYLWGFNIPVSMAKMFSIFQSSVRFYWPLTLAAVLAPIVWISRHSRFAVVLLAIAATLQIVDIQGHANHIQQRPNGQTPEIFYDKSLWEATPRDYQRFTFLWSVNILAPWDECAYAAATTRRIANCGYLSRVTGLEFVNATNERRVTSDDLNPDTVYWLTAPFQGRFEEAIRRLDASGQHLFVMPNGKSAASGEHIVYLFPYCRRFDQCAFLGSRGKSYAEILKLKFGPKPLRY